MGVGQVGAKGWAEALVGLGLKGREWELGGCGAEPGGRVRPGLTAFVGSRAETQVLLLELLVALL